MATTGGIPTPERSDAADAPAQTLAMAQAIDLRLTALDGQADDSILTLSERVTLLEGKVTTLQTSTAATQTELTALKTLVNNVFGWTNLPLGRIEVRSIMVTSDWRGFFGFSFVNPFHVTPIVLVMPGTGAAVIRQDSSWGGPASVFTHDNSWGGWYTEAISASGMVCGGLLPNSTFRINYIALGTAKYTDRSAASGGPGFAFYTPPF